MSRMPVASTTRTPGAPRAKRSYQASTSGVTKPSSVARQGTIAGTHVRSARVKGPTRIGENQREEAASSRVGQRGTDSSFSSRRSAIPAPLSNDSDRAELDGNGPQLQPIRHQAVQGR